MLSIGLLTLVACQPKPPEPVVADAFTVIFIGDTEPRMRGNTDAEVAGAVRNLVSLKSNRVRYFNANGGKQYRIDPKLVILGGDISADRTTSIAADLPLYEPLYRAGVPFIAGFGNHDWDSIWNADPHSEAGQLSNEDTTAFTRETYRRSAAMAGGITYQEVAPSASHGPTTFFATFRGVDIANFNTFLYEPSYDYPQDSPLGCTASTSGPCPLFRSAEPQIAAMDTIARRSPKRTMLVVQHYPLSTNRLFWSDYGATGRTYEQRRQRLLQFMATHDKVALFAAHNHTSKKTIHEVNGRIVGEYIAPYFGGDGGHDPSRAGGSLAILVSPTKGILEVKELPPG
ncbi:MAG: metallophosphoesterase [Aquihabitans sp.]